MIIKTYKCADEYGDSMELSGHRRSEGLVAGLTVNENGDACSIVIANDDLPDLINTLIDILEGKEV